MCSDARWLLGLCISPGALQHEHAVHVGAAVPQQQNNLSQEENLRSLLWVSWGCSAEWKAESGSWPSRALGVNRMCWECSAVDLERGASVPRDVLCLHQIESLRCVSTCFRQLRQLQLPYCWVHKVQFLCGPCEVPELWHWSQGWKCCQRIRT